MLTIVVLLICAIIGISLAAWFCDNDNDIFSFITGFIGVVCSALCLISVTCAISENITKDATIAKYEECYKTLTCQVENFDILYGNSAANDKKELLNDVQKWNEDIAYGLKMHTNLWTNWMYPIDYTQFKFIEMPKFEEKVS